MKHFTDLVSSMVLTKGVDDFTAPARQQREAADKFPAILERCGLHLWSPNAKLPLDVARLVIGVATWSRPDMQFLDELSVWALPLERSGVNAEVFDVSGFESLREFDERIPDLGMVHHTPVVGIWENGEWQSRASGHEARRLIFDYVRRQTEEALMRLLEPETMDRAVGSRASED